MPLLFDHHTCLDARRELGNVARLGIPAPDDAGRANSLHNPLGRWHARGWFLLPRSAVDIIDLNARHSITFDALEYGSFTAYGLYITKCQRLTSGDANDPDPTYLLEVADGRFLLNDPNLRNGILPGVDPAKFPTQFNVRAPAYGGLYYEQTVIATTHSQDDGAGISNLGPEGANAPPFVIADIPVEDGSGFIPGAPLAVGSGANVERTTVIAAGPDVVKARLTKHHLGFVDNAVSNGEDGFTVDTPYWLQQPCTLPQVVAVLWGHLDKVLGPFPGFDFTGDAHVWENLCWPGVTAWDALNQILDVLGQVIACDLSAVTDQYSIVKVGAPHAGFTALQEQLAERNQRIFDADYFESTITVQPAGLTVYFNRVDLIYGTEQAVTQSVNQWATRPSHHEDVVNPNPGTKAPYNHILWDSMLVEWAQASDGTLFATNVQMMKDRAQSRAKDFFRAISGKRLHHVYSGAHGFSPGPACKLVSWYQDVEGIGDPEQPDGIMTAIYNHPFMGARLLDSGKAEWCCFEDSTNYHAPDFRPTWPIYPPLTKVVEISSKPGFEYAFYDMSDAGEGDPPGGLFQANLCEYNSETGEWDKKEVVWVTDLNGGVASTEPNTIFPANLVGHAKGGPVWAFPPVTIPWQHGDGPRMFGTILVTAVLSGQIDFAAAGPAVNFGASEVTFVIDEANTGQASPEAEVVDFSMGFTVTSLVGMGGPVAVSDAKLRIGTAALIPWIWQSTDGNPEPDFGITGNEDAGVGASITTGDQDVWDFQLSRGTAPEVG